MRTHDSGLSTRAAHARDRIDGRGLRIIVLGGASSVPGLALAQSAASEGPSLVPMIVALVFVLALVPVAMWLLKRLGAVQPAASAGLRVVAQLPLGPRERIVVVEAGERWLLLGVTAASINRVGTLPKGDAEALQAAPSSFVALLNAARGRHADR